MITKEQNAAYFRKWYAANKKKQIERVAANKRKNAKLVWKIKEDGECIHCGEDFPECLDFHHRDPKEKTHTISHMATRGYGIKAIRAEIAKCDLVCANCHRKIHA
jgi:hypothetical protein